MTYDLAHGQHSSVEHTAHIVDMFIQRGAPRKKLFLGIPCYGRVQGAPETVKTYSELMEAAVTNSAGQVVAENDFYQHAGHGFHYNGRQMVGQKTSLVKEQALGGVFFWEAGQDYLMKGLSLLEAAALGVHSQAIHGEGK